MTRPSFSAAVRCVVLTLGLVVAATAITKAQYVAPNFRVYNGGSQTIMVLNVSPHGYNSWGPDLLGDNELNPGYFVRALAGFSLPSCIQDVRAIYADHEIQYFWGIDVCTENLTFRR